VGPDAITSSGSPITSDRISEITLDGYAISASLPPFMAEICFLTALSSFMSAPDLSSSSVVCCFSLRDIPLGGAASRAEPPPDTRQSTRSLVSVPFSISITFFVAISPFLSGIGCPASKISMLLFNVPFTWPYFVIIIPVVTISGMVSSSAFAIGKAALPKPIRFNLLQCSLL